MLIFFFHQCRERWSTLAAYPSLSPITLRPTAPRPSSLPYQLSEATNDLLAGDARTSSLHVCLSSCDSPVPELHSQLPVRHFYLQLSVSGLNLWSSPTPLCSSRAPSLRPWCHPPLTESQVPSDCYHHSLLPHTREVIKFTNSGSEMSFFFQL